MKSGGVGRPYKKGGVSHEEHKALYKLLYLEFLLRDGPRSSEQLGGASRVQGWVNQFLGRHPPISTHNVPGAD